MKNKNNGIKVVLLLLAVFLYIVGLDKNPSAAMLGAIAAICGFVSLDY